MGFRNVTLITQNVLPQRASTTACHVYRGTAVAWRVQYAGVQETVSVSIGMRKGSGTNKRPMLRRLPTADASYVPGMYLVHTVGYMEFRSLSVIRLCGYSAHCGQAEEH